jgi:hypothetical protein
MIYQIKIKGLLDRQWTDWFGGMSISPTEGGDTLLTGPVEDQAALHGMLKKVRDLGRPLLSVNRIDDGNTLVQGKEKEMNVDRIRKYVVRACLCSRSSRWG